MSRCLISLILFLAFATPQALIAADIVTTQMTETEQGGSEIEKNTLSEADRIRARIWGLSEVEWRRYIHLMQGIRGSISPATISPIEVLGIHARDNAERDHYAETWAKAMREDVQRILFFQRAYNAAGKRLYPNDPVIDVSRLPVKPEIINKLKSADRLLFFAHPECPACDLMMGKLLKRLDDISGIDIYLMGVETGNDADVRAWASTQKINPDWVKNRRITLNYDGGTLDKLSKGQGKVPYVLRRRGESLSQLRASDL